MTGSRNAVMTNSIYAAVFIIEQYKKINRNVLTHLSAEADSDVACLDMTSIRALVVSENLDMSTGAGTLKNETPIG